MAQKNVLVLFEFGRDINELQAVEYFNESVQVALNFIICLFLLHRRRDKGQERETTKEIVIIAA